MIKRKIIKFLAKRLGFFVISVLNKSLEEWENYLNSIGEKKFRSQQILNWIYHKKIHSIDEMTNLPNSLRETLKNNFTISALTKIQMFSSKKDVGTHKILFKTNDGQFIEAVIMPNTKESFTICISSQVGCAFNCDFCATGKMGFIRNLEVEEILYQVYFAMQKFKISNIVFMGMGEPFLNPHLFDVLTRLTDEHYFNFASRNITLSTIGVPDGIEKMIHYKQIKLAWSYHSYFTNKREKIFPVLSSKYHLKDLLKAFTNYQEKTKKRITIEYLLLKNFNDEKEEAIKLIELSKNLFFHLNIIPYNSHPYSQYKTPQDEEVKKFVNYFKEVDFEVTLRKSLGQDIAGACGQLANINT